MCGYRVAGDRLAILRFLADQGADSKSPGKDGWPPIAEAMWWGHAQVLDFFAGQGVDLRAKLPGPIPRSTPGYTLLHIAAVQGNLACVR